MSGPGALNFAINHIHQVLYNATLATVSGILSQISRTEKTREDST
jgi:hypothetical protein